MAEVLEVGGAFLIGVFGGALLVCFFVGAGNNRFPR